MREININPKSILLELFGRNTTPAILFSAFKSLEIENNPHLLILSSDHQINDEKKFRDMIEIAKKYSTDNKLVTFGVVPTSPETGYGYIKSEKPLNMKNILGVEISEFIEKPDLKKAKEFIKDSSFTWNSGIFMFKAKNIIEEIKDKCPDMFKVCEKTFFQSKKDLDFLRLNEESFKDCPNISIDNAVMENTKKGIVIPLDAKWSDIGSWKLLWENSSKDKDGNFTKGRVISEKNQNCYLTSENKLLVSIGVNNLIIICTDDVTLVADINESESIKKLVQDLQLRNYKEAVSHKRVYRPWGFLFINIREF